MIIISSLKPPVYISRGLKSFNKPKINFCSKDTFKKSYICDYIFCENKNKGFDDYPSDYFFEKSGKYFLNPHYYIFELISLKKGGGTTAIKNVVRKSVENPLSQGRVILYSIALNKGEYSSGFYYKLGFRFIHESQNEIMEDWLTSGGKRENAPILEGKMYLPKENIEHCLNY